MGEKKPPKFFLDQIMGEHINISASEWEIMEVLWDEAPLSAATVIERLREPRYGRQSWNAKTIRTFLARLTQKDCLAVSERGGIQHFTPAVDRADTVRTASRSFLNQFFDGTLSSMFAHFLHREEVSPEELAELRRLLEETDDDPREARP